jgi:hypothetical protein
MHERCGIQMESQRFTNFHKYYMNGINAELVMDKNRVTNTGLIPVTFSWSCLVKSTTFIVWECRKTWSCVFKGQIEEKNRVTGEERFFVRSRTRDF